MLTTIFYKAFFHNLFIPGLFLDDYAKGAYL